MTKLQASELVATLMAAFPQSQVSEATTGVYEEDLAELDFAIGIKACTRLRRTCKFLPSVAEILSAVADIEYGPQRPGGEAWCDVLEQSRRVGYCGTPRFEDPIVTEIVRRTGWREMCLSQDGAPDRARFIELYDQLARQARLDLVSGVPLTRRLPGASSTPKSLTHAVGPKDAATGQPDGSNGPSSMARLLERVPGGRRA